MLLRSILTTFLALLLLQNAFALSGDRETNTFSNAVEKIDTVEAIPVNDPIANFDTWMPSPQGQYEPPVPEQTTGLIPGNDFFQTNTGVTFPVITPIDAGASDYAPLARDPATQTMDQEKSTTNVLPPLPPGLQYDLPPLPDEVAVSLTTLPVVPVAITQEKTMQEVLPPLPEGMQYDLPPVPAEVAESLTALPVVTTAAAAEPALLPRESTEKPTLAEEKTAEEPLASARSTGIFSFVDSLLTNALSRGVEAKKEEMRNLGNVPDSIDAQADPASTTSPAGNNSPALIMDPVFTRELDRLGHDSIGKEYHNDLTELIQTIKADPQSFSTNTILQAKFDNILERAARDEAPSTNSAPAVLSAPIATDAGASLPAALIASPAPEQAGLQDFLTDYGMGLAPLPQENKPDYVEDWPRLEEKPATASVLQTDRQAETQGEVSQKENVENLKEVLGSLKGSSYEQEAQNILTKIQTNAAPEEYQDEVTALIRKIDAGAGVHTQPIPLMISGNIYPAITVPDVARDSQSKRNSVPTAASPR